MQDEETVGLDCMVLPPPPPPAPPEVFVGATHCNSCPPGTFSEGNATVCERCGLGRYSATAAATSADTCLRCGPGHYTALQHYNSSDEQRVFGLVLGDDRVHNVEVGLTSDNELVMNVDSRGWGSVCDDGFGEDEATAVCRSLGYQAGTAEAYPCEAHHSACSHDWFALDGLDCPEDSFLTSCHATERPYQHNCKSHEAVILHCGAAEPSRGFVPAVGLSGPFRSDSHPVFSLMVDDASRSAQVRLSEDEEPRGFLEIQIDGRGWGAVCDDSFDEDAAVAACNSLGVESGQEPRYTARPHALMGEWFAVDNLWCPSDAANLESCEVRSPAIYNHNCRSHEAVYLDCTGQASGWLAMDMGGERRSVEARISEGNFGVLELNIDDEGWGAVCDDGFGDREARTFCELLGFGENIGTQFDTTHGGNSFAADDISCDDDGTCSTDTDPYSDNCSDSETVGLDCSSGATPMATSASELGTPAAPAGITTGATHCNSCPAGTYNEAGDAVCEACSPGKYSSVSRASSPAACSDCPSGQVSASGLHRYSAGFLLVYGEPIRARVRIEPLSEGSSSHARGILQMSVDGGRFGPVCDDGFGAHEASVMCAALGFDGSVATYFTHDGETSAFVADDVSCSGDTFEEGCAANLYDNCGYSETLGIDCGPSSSWVTSDTMEGYDTCSGCGDGMLVKDECDEAPHTCDIVSGCEVDDSMRTGWKIVLGLMLLCVACCVASNIHERLTREVRRAREREREERERELRAEREREQMAALRKTSSIPLQLKKQPSVGDEVRALMQKPLSPSAITPRSVKLDPGEGCVQCSTCQGAGVLAPGIGVYSLPLGDTSIGFSPDSVPPTVDSVSEDSPLVDKLRPGDVVLRVSYWKTSELMPDSPSRGMPAVDCALMTGDELQMTLMDELDFQGQERLITVRSVNAHVWKRAQYQGKPLTCFVCAGSGAVSKLTGRYTAPEEADEMPCEICYGESKYGLSTRCEHFYCEECIRKSLEAMLDSGQMPPYCPACRTEAMSEGHSEPMHGRIEGKALSFLEQEGVLTKDFQFRMLRQMEEKEGERFFACPAKCGRYLIDQDPQYAMVPRGATSDAGFDRKMRLGKCECGAHVCVNCHQQAVKTVSASGEEEYSHTCPTALNRDEPTDAATLELLKTIGKKCPNCGNWIQKNDGCNVMMCGTEAHGRLSDALARGGVK